MLYGIAPRRNITDRQDAPLGQALASARSRSVHSTSRGSSADREPEQPGGAALSLPAVPRLELRARAAQARRVLDRGRRHLHAPGRCGVGDVERDQEPEAGVARGDHGGVGGETVRELARGRLHAPEPYLERLQPAFQQPGRVGRRDEPHEPAGQVEPLEEGVVAYDGDSGEEVVVAAEHLRRAVQRDVAALLERSEPHRRRKRRVADHRCAMRGARLEVRHRQHRVRGRLDQDQIRVSGGRTSLVELDGVQPPRLQMVEQLLVPVVRARGDRDRAAGREHRQHAARDGAHPGGVEERPTALEHPEDALDRDRVRMLRADVGVRPRLARLVVGPGGRAVEGAGHAPTLARER